MQWAFRNSYTYTWHVRMACCGLRLRMTVRLLWVRSADHCKTLFSHYSIYTVFVRSLGHSRTLLTHAHVYRILVGNPVAHQRGAETR